MARRVGAQFLASVPASKATPTSACVTAYVTWFCAPPLIILQSAWLASQWLSSLAWAPMWPVATAGKARGDSVLKRSRQVIATPGSNVVRITPAANDNWIAMTTKARDGSAKILAFPRRRRTRRP